MDLIALGIKWQSIVFLSHIVIIRGFKEHLHPAVHRLDAPSPGCPRHLRRASVDDDHFRNLVHFHRQRAHVIHVQIKGLSVDRDDGLEHQQRRIVHLREHPLHRPHTVVFDDHPVRVILQHFTDEEILIEIFFLLHIYDGRVGLLQQIFIILFHALLAGKQECSLSVIKIIFFQCFLNKCGLSALQKSHEHINRNLHFFLSRHTHPPSDSISQTAP